MPKSTNGCPNRFRNGTSITKRTLAGEFRKNKKQKRLSTSLHFGSLCWFKIIIDALENSEQKQRVWTSMPEASHNGAKMDAKTRQRPVQTIP